MTNQNLKNVTFVLADDHSLIRQGMEIVIEEAGFEGNIYHASTLQKLLKCVSENEIEIAVIDAVFPDGNSVTIIPELKKIKPELKVLVFSGLEEEDYALKFFNAGANGFLTKVSEEEEIKNALLKIYHEGRYISTVSQGLMMASLQVSPKQNLLSKLTEREIQIVKMYVQGYGNLEIANQLDIKQNTVSTIKKRVFEKLDIDNLVDLADLLKSL
ncbi:two component transcriptional regulator, LuxR family [Chryseobacterium piscicola]|jgi:DNA-binding NarL/FixJ family response regulator|uniref:DNA-binding response regulator n=1 Tax=Chryseobacterium piscicola TaxID=551459 RepID=A0A1N7MDY8_9FLAO|nr:response regulator transcription factor [Chryseobacterium piscicola]PQA98067.1 DNA-binding response regulator [Chryseobacterium piscicola]SIS84277.1 two component transcriptional regulator, LuxR family [Chryseobacterium piscicola]